MSPSIASAGSRRAFSLIEVLIAVLILALGLLGLGALFPVVIREQRLGTDATQGVLASTSARTQLDSLNIPADLWTAWRDTPATIPPVAGQQGGIPVPSDFSPAGPLGVWFVPSVDPDSGRLTLGLDDGVPNNPPDPRYVPLYDRLYPRDTPGVTPQFVWDVAVQRVPGSAAAGGGEALRFAIFVRRLDPRIRVAPGNLSGTSRPMTLLDVLTNRTAVPQSAWRVPVAIDPANDIPTQDGLGTTNNGPNYSTPMTVRVAFNYDTTGGVFSLRDRLWARNDYSQAEKRRWALARQINQKLIDNLGNQYTVIEAGVEGRQEYVRISPEVPSYVTREMSSLTGVGSDAIREVVFTPQVPAGVVMWTVKP